MLKFSDWLKNETGIDWQVNLDRTPFQEVDYISAREMLEKHHKRVQPGEKVDTLFGTGIFKSVPGGEFIDVPKGVRSKRIFFKDDDIWWSVNKKTWVYKARR